MLKKRLWTYRNNLRISRWRAKVHCEIKASMNNSVPFLGSTYLIPHKIANAEEVLFMPESNLLGFCSLVYLDFVTTMVNLLSW